MLDLAGGVEDEHVPGQRVSLPPAQARVERQPCQHRDRQYPVNGGNPALGAQYRVPERPRALYVLARCRLYGRDSPRYPVVARYPAHPLR